MWELYYYDSKGNPVVELTFQSFHGAVDELAKKDGKWSANWSLSQLNKGAYHVSPAEKSS